MVRWHWTPRKQKRLQEEGKACTNVEIEAYKPSRCWGRDGKDRGGGGAALARWVL